MFESESKRDTKSSCTEETGVSDEYYPPPTTVVFVGVFGLGSYPGSISRLGRTAKEFVVRHCDDGRGTWRIYWNVVGA